MPASGSASHAPRLLRLRSAVALATLLLLAACTLLVLSSTGDNVRLGSRIAAFLLPVVLGAQPLVVCAAVLRKKDFAATPAFRGLLGVYFGLLALAGLALARSSFGISGPPPMASAPPAATPSPASS